MHFSLQAHKKVNGAMKHSSTDGSSSLSSTHSPELRPAPGQRGVLRILVLSLYSCVSFFVALLATPLLCLTKRGRSRLLERFGVWGKVADGRPLIWFHGASFGEVNGLLPLIRRTRAERPEAKILLTATSITGLERGAPFVDCVRILPFDSAPFLTVALRRLDPELFLFGETELWPALFSALSKKGVPMLLVNGRISERSFRRYRHLRWLLAPMLAALHRVLVSEPRSEHWFLELGAPRERTRVLGNAKYDGSLPTISSHERAELRGTLFGREAPLLVLGSLRPEEEAVWFEALASHAGSALNVVVAPRHAEKFEFFAEELSRRGLRFHRRSQGGACQGQGAVAALLLDTLGELDRVYSCADCAFVGGTLSPRYGGHNPLEPARYSVAIVTGPWGAVIEEIMCDLRAKEAAVTVSSTADAARVLRMLDSPEDLRRIGQSAFEVWRHHAGAAERIMEEVRAIWRH